MRREGCVICEEPHAHNSDAWIAPTPSKGAKQAFESATLSTAPLSWFASGRSGLLLWARLALALRGVGSRLCLGPLRPFSSIVFF